MQFRIIIGLIQGQICLAVLALKEIKIEIYVYLNSLGVKIVVTPLMLIYI